MAAVHGPLGAPDGAAQVIGAPDGEAQVIGAPDRAAEAMDAPGGITRPSQCRNTGPGRGVFRQTCDPDPRQTA